MTDIAAESSGVNVTYYKLMAFVLAAFFAGVAGVLYGHTLANIKPAMFDYNMSIEILVIVVLGGMGSIRGSIIAAIILTGSAGDAARRCMTTGCWPTPILLIVMMLLNSSRSLRQCERSVVPESPAEPWEGPEGEQRKRRRRSMKIDNCRCAAAGFAAGSVPQHAAGAGARRPHAPVLEASRLGIDFGGLTAVDDFNSHHRPHGDRRTDRPQRRREDHGLQPAHQASISPPGAPSCIDGDATAGKSTASGQPHGHRPYLPEYPPVQRHERDRQCEGGHAQQHPVQPAGPPCSALPRLLARRSSQAGGQALELLDIFGMAEHGACTWPAACPTAHSASLEIVRALATKPKLLLLDEPAAGMNPSETAELMENIRTHPGYLPASPSCSSSTI